MISGAPLVERGGQTMLIRKSLDLAADALAQGQAIPQSAQETMARPVIPSWAYRLMGDLGWLMQARQYRALRSLKRRPYQAEVR